MKINSMIRYPYKAKYWDYNITGSGASGGDTREYFENGVVEFTGGLGPSSNLVIYTKTALRDFARLDTITGPDGDLVIPWEKQAQGAVYEVRTCQPRLNFWGHVEGYRINLVRM